MSRQRAKGTAAETAACLYLTENGHPSVRKALTGSADQGDITVADWPWLTVEVKNHRTPQYRDWLRQAEAERANAGTDIGICLHKPHGVGLDRVAEWHVVMTASTFLRLVDGNY